MHAPSSHNTLTIATYNIFLWSNPEKIAANILALCKEGVTIFCLQEVLHTAGKPFVGEIVQQKLGKEWHIQYLLGSTGTYIDHGLAIMWHTKIVTAGEIQRVKLPQHGKISLFFQMVKYLTGFKKETPSERRALSIVFTYGKKAFRITTTHIDIVGGQAHRLKQHQYIKSTVLTKSMTHEIICGDFNTIGMSSKKEVNAIRRTYGKDFTEACSQVSWTQDLHDCLFAFHWLNVLIAKAHIHLHQNLDHILVKGFTPLVAKRVHLTGSDHFPLISTLEF